MKLDPAKLARVVSRVDALAERLDHWTSERMPAPLIERRADAWDESKHPRGPDGKFVEGEGAAGASAAEYLAKQKKEGKKATPNGMMAHLLLNGGITKQEIWETTKANFEMAPHLNNYVSAVAATMKKKGIDVPEPPKAKKGGDNPTPKKEEKPKTENKPVEPMKDDAFDKWAENIATETDKTALEDYGSGIDYAKGKGYITAAQAEKLHGLVSAQKKSLAKPPANPAPAPGKSALPKPKASSVAQGDMHAIATDPSITTENKIAQLTAKHDNMTLPANKEYAAKLIQALGGNAPAVPAPAPLPQPQPKPLEQTLALQSELADLKQKWKGILPVNKAPVDAMEKQLDAALALLGDAQTQALSQITPIPSPVGMGQASANAFLAKAQQAAGIAPTTANHPVNAPLTSSLPAGPSKKLQSAIFEELKDTPSNFFDGVSKLEGAHGKIRSRVRIDTDMIPKDQYAKITAAYGNNRADAMTQAVDEAMKEYEMHSFHKLDQATKDAIKSYQGTGYGSINGALLAGSEGSGYTKKKIDLIKKAIENSVIPADTPAFRGMKCTLKDLSGFDDPQKSVGRAFVHKNFASISRSQETARNFGEQVMLKMTVPAGTRGLVMTGQKYVPGDMVEREIMLQANSVFRIDKVEQMANSSGTSAKHLIHVTYMGTKEDA